MAKIIITKEKRKSMDIIPKMNIWLPYISLLVLNIFSCCALLDCILYFFEYIGSSSIFCKRKTKRCKQTNKYNSQCYICKQTCEVRKRYALRIKPDITFFVTTIFFLVYICFIMREVEIIKQTVVVFTFLIGYPLSLYMNWGYAFNINYTYHTTTHKQNRKISDKRKDDIKIRNAVKNNKTLLLLSVCYAFTAGNSLYQVYEHKLVFSIILGIIVFVVSLIFLPGILKGCQIHIDIFDRVGYVDDSNMVFYLLLLPCLAALYEYVFFPGNGIQSSEFLLLFPLIVMAILLLIFFLRILGRKVSIVGEQTNQTNKVWTIGLCIFIQLVLSLAIVLYVFATQKDALLHSNDNTGDIGFIDKIYFVVMTFTSVGYGDIYPATDCVKAISCIISLSGFLFGALLIGAICHMFQDTENTDNHNSKKVKWISIVGKLMIVLSPIVMRGSFRYTNNNDGMPNILEIIYYIIITFTSVGYGDIVPVVPISKLIACAISILGYYSSAYLISSVYNKMQKHK